LLAEVKIKKCINEMWKNTSSHKGEPIIVEKLPMRISINFTVVNHLMQERQVVAISLLKFGVHKSNDYLKMILVKSWGEMKT
jgi:hypothetical protein